MKAVDKVTVNGSDYAGKFLLDNNKMVVEHGRLVLGGVKVDGGDIIEPTTVAVDGVVIVKDGNVVYDDGVALIEPKDGVLDVKGKAVVIDGANFNGVEKLESVARIDMVGENSKLVVAGVAVAQPDGTYELEEVTELPVVTSPADVEIHYSTKLNPSTTNYQSAGDWNGNLLAVQGIVAVLWALVLARFRNRKVGYSLSLLIGGLGFLSIFFVHNQYLLFISYGLAGCGWAAMLAMPFTILTNALSGKNIGTYLGLFNCTICLPQIVAALCGGLLLGLFPVVSDGPSAGAPNTVGMLVTSGVLLILGALSVWIIKETSGEKSSREEIIEATDKTGELAAADI
ncbi:MAG: MFS transporter [Muribaculaceae bacterium]|nr:MFS transporter [Muribaculaceae bacterium]